MSDRNPVIPLRTSRSGKGSLLIRLPRSAGLLLDGVPAPPEQLLLGLGSTSTLELRALAERRRTPASVAAVLSRLARAAEQAMTRPRLLDHIVLTGGGTVPSGIRPLLATYARRITPPERAHAALTADDPIDLVIAVTSEALDLARCAAWAARDVPVLPVVARGDLVVIGPLLTAHRSPCARCIELHRVDRDPRRGDLLVSTDPGLHDVDQLDLDPAQAAMVIGLVATLVRCLGQGVPLPPALSLTVRMPYPEVGHHEWTPHPRCRCTVAPA
jgi:bacteriocin biosynthesis cyclodehydratase domain-containing protein